LPEHSNLLKIYEIIEDKFNVNIVMELGECDLGTYIERGSYPLD
jgi:hypothetical protein